MAAVSQSVLIKALPAARRNAIHLAGDDMYREKRLSSSSSYIALKQFCARSIKWIIFYMASGQEEMTALSFSYVMLVVVHYVTVEIALLGMNAPGRRELVGRRHRQQGTNGQQKREEDGQSERRRSVHLVVAAAARNATLLQGRHLRAVLPQQKGTGLEEGAQRFLRLPRFPQGNNDPFCHNYLVMMSL